MTTETNAVCHTCARPIERPTERHLRLKTGKRVGRIWILVCRKCQSIKPK